VLRRVWSATLRLEEMISLLLNLSKHCWSSWGVVALARGAMGDMSGTKPLIITTDSNSL
jgi:hypothetical protein